MLTLDGAEYPDESGAVDKDWGRLGVAFETAVAQLVAAVKFF